MHETTFFGNGQAAFEAGEEFGRAVATLGQAFIQAGGRRDADEVDDVLLALSVGSAARGLKLRGIPSDLIEVWIAAAVAAGRARIRRSMKPHTRTRADTIDVLTNVCRS